MIEEEHSGQDSKMGASRFTSKMRNTSKLSKYQTNIKNYSDNQKLILERIDPKGVAASGIYGSFSGVIENAELLTNCDQTFHVSYQVVMGHQWHDETPETDDTEGESHFCESKNGNVAISLSFDFLASCMYISSWPKLLITIKSFNYKGQLVPKGYAHIDLPSQNGQFVKQAYVYSIVRNQSWYHRWIPFCSLYPSGLDSKQVERVIIQGQGRDTQKIKNIGKLNIRVQTLVRNFQRFGYK